ncbi:dTDP-4-dehydrorhamnose reductase [Nitrosomonas communis]|uniref:dTDP-4-dehydrorhamnose reductase n=1 Tax=Nitrosomonas communis TaxID=44574 RepID=UPI003D2C30B9
MKFLLTGKQGQLGFELQRALAPLGEIITIGRTECDLSDADTLSTLVRHIKPDVIINAAAYTAVDKAESDSATAFAVNGTALGILGNEAAKLGGLVVHYSTDYVFDGTKSGWYIETDTPNPQSVYGQSKLQGEQALMNSDARHLILRTSWVIGAHGGNFAKTILRLAVERESLNIVADQYGTPTSAALLADVTAHLVRQAARKKEVFPYGLYHVVAGGETNWYEYACTVIEAARLAGKPIKVARDAIQAISTADYPTPAKRPMNSRLDTSKLRETFGLQLPEWRQGLNHILQQILSTP